MLVSLILDFSVSGSGVVFGGRACLLQIEMDVRIERVIALEILDLGVQIGLNTRSKYSNSERTLT